MDDPNSVMIRRLDALLDDERDALLSGDLPRLAELVAKKEEIMDALALIEQEIAEDLHPLGQKAVRNQALLETAMDGIRSAAKRLSDLRQIKKSFDTYNHMGERNRIESDPKTTVEKRA